MNLYCALLLVICMLMLVYNMGDRAMECYNLGKGMYRDVPNSGWWTTKLLAWGVDMQVLFLCGIIFVLIIRNINKAIVFSWKNIQLFRVLGIVMFIHFILSTGINFIDHYILETYKDIPYELYTGNVIDYAALIASVFILIIAEVFAVGLRLQEEQELTI